MRSIKITKDIKIEQLYLRVTCSHCQRQYGVHLRRVNQARTCPCGRATFYFTVGQFRNYITFSVLWVGPWEERKEIEVDQVEIAEEVVPWEDELSPSSSESSEYQQGDLIYWRGIPGKILERLGTNLYLAVLEDIQEITLRGDELRPRRKENDE